MENDPHNNPGPNEPPDAAAAPKGLPRCPRCGWHNVRLSHAHHPWDLALSLIALAAFRCRSCGHRFHRFRKRPEGEE
jgi:transposase-like protein